MNILAEIKRVPITTQFATSLIAVIAAVVLKIIHTLTYYDMQTGLYEGGVLSTLLDLSFYLLTVIAVCIAVCSTITILPFYRRISRHRPVIIGYTLFFVAVMFMVEGVVSFWRHIAAIAEAHTNFAAMTIMQKASAFMPYLIDLVCILCAIALYKMAMESFIDENEKPKPIVMSVIPAIWSALILLQIIISTTTKLYVQRDTEQIIFGVINSIFLYYLAAQYINPRGGRRKSFFSLLIAIAYPILSVAFIMPYLILMLFKVSDPAPVMPFFAMLGIMIYSVAEMFCYLVSASVLQQRCHHPNRAVIDEFVK